MIVSIHQPQYLPWLGLLDRIRSSDKHVILDNVQFEKGSFTNRNKIRNKDSSFWLTVPLKRKTDRTIYNLEIDYDSNWQSKHLKSMINCYRKEPFFIKYWHNFESLLLKKYATLADLNIEMLSMLMDFYGIDTKLILASDLETKYNKSDLILEICVKTGADKYLSGTNGEDYLNLNQFKVAGIDVEFQDVSKYEPIACVDDLFRKGGGDKI